MYIKENLPKYLLFIFIILWLLMAINPISRLSWIAENSLLVIFVFTLCVTYKKFVFSNASYIFIFIFLVFHMVGAHYTYAKVPLGFWISDLFNLGRNHFDRIVHFSFGFLLFYPLQEFLLRFVKFSSYAACCFAISLIVSFSSIFEIIEWLIAINVSTQLVSEYVATQGDTWDAQKDMALATLGSVFSAFIYYLCKLYASKKAYN